MYFIYLAKTLKRKECISRALGISACSWIYEINYGKDADEAFKISNRILKTFA